MAPPPVTLYTCLFTLTYRFIEEDEISIHHLSVPTPSSYSRGTNTHERPVKSTEFKCRYNNNNNNNNNLNVPNN